MVICRGNYNDENAYEIGKACSKCDEGESCQNNLCSKL